MALGQHAAAPAAVASTALLSFLSGLLLAGRLGGPAFHPPQDWQQLDQVGIGNPSPSGLSDNGRAWPSDKDKSLSSLHAAEASKARGRLSLPWPLATHHWPRSLAGNSKHENAKAADSESSSPLPTGWEARQDPKTGKWFFFNKVFSKDSGASASADDGTAVDDRKSRQEVSSKSKGTSSDDGIAVDDRKSRQQVSSESKATSADDGIAVDDRKTRQQVSSESKGTSAADGIAVDDRNSRQEVSSKSKGTSADDGIAVDERKSRQEVSGKSKGISVDDGTAVDDGKNRPKKSGKGKATSVNNGTAEKERKRQPKVSRKGKGISVDNGTAVQKRPGRPEVSNRSAAVNKTARGSNKSNSISMDDGVAVEERAGVFKASKKSNGTSVYNGTAVEGSAGMPKVSGKNKSTSLADGDQGPQGSSESNDTSEDEGNSTSEDEGTAMTAIPNPSEASNKSNGTSLDAASAMAEIPSPSEASNKSNGTSQEEGAAVSARERGVITTTTTTTTLSRMTALEEGEEFLTEEGISEDRRDVEIEQAIASMTLGSVAFQMSLFYLANHRDQDMRRYAYGVIGETISIFCAVLTFNAMYSWVEDYMAHMDEKLQMVILAAVCAFFYLGMEFTVAASARVRGEVKHTKLHGKELHIFRHVLNAKTFGAGAAQMCGAACIRGFGHLQFRAYQQYDSIWLTIAVVPLAFLFFIMMMWFSTKVRIAMINCDGVVDDTELTWVEVAEECENEVCGLCMGFLLAVIARVLLTDSLPYILLHGFEHSGSLEVSTFRDTVGLLLVGFLCACITIGLVGMTFGTIESAINEETIASGFGPRSLVLIIKILGFSFSWSLCFGMHLFGIQVAVFREGIRLRLILALVQSMMSFLIIAMLDFLSDLECTGAAFDKAIVTLIETLAVSIGLSWEHAFHECVDITVQFMVEDKTLFKASRDPKFWSLWVCVMIVVTVLPAYRLYIVPTRYQLLEEYEERMKSREKIYRQSVLVRSERSMAGGLEQTYQFRGQPLHHT